MGALRDTMGNGSRANKQPTKYRNNTQSVFVYMLVCMQRLKGHIKKTQNCLILTVQFSSAAYFHLFVYVIIELAPVNITNKHPEIKARQREVCGYGDFLKG